MEQNIIHLGDCSDVLKTIPDESVNCCVTSPPYYGLRDYQTAKWEGGDDKCDHLYQKGGTNPEISSKQISNAGTIYSQYERWCKKCGAVRIDSQIGLEETPEAYVQKMVEVFREVRRVLKKNGTVFLNLGDSYAGSGMGAANYPHLSSEKQKSNNGSTTVKGRGGLTYGLKPKDLIGIPWMVAFALRSDGWYLRQDIIWNKPNPMPESVTDRCTKAHEYIFLLSKSARYYYDAEAVKEAANYAGENRGKSSNVSPKGITVMDNKQYDYRNKRSVWTVTTKPYNEAHFATYPEDLISPCILAGCPENGIVLDPFMGAGTTGLVASKLNRNYIGIELNAEYKRIADERIMNEIGLFH